MKKEYEACSVDFPDSRLRSLWGGLCIFLLPLLRQGFGLGAAFGECVCLLGLLILLFYGKLSRQGGWKKAAARLAASFYCVGLAWALYLTALMFSAVYNTPPENTNVIVLGARVYSAERMSVSLSNRVERALSYLEENPESLCIVTGGQGRDEPCPEALAQKNALLAQGISEDRIFVEDQSSNTRENLRFAKEIAEEQGLGEEVAMSPRAFTCTGPCSWQRRLGLPLTVWWRKQTPCCFRNITAVSCFP